MKITGLKINNFLIIKDVEIKALNSKLNAFIGKNRDGKTSIIKAITTGLRGTTDPTVIRQGADKAEIMIDIEGLKVQRTITKKGVNKVKVVTPMGDIKASPQAYLDGLLSDFSFDPIQFVLMEGKERIKYLREIFKTKLLPKQLDGKITADIISRLDFSKDGLDILKEAENIIYPMRAEKNKQVASKQVFFDEVAFGLDNFDPETYQDRTAEIDKYIQDTERQLTEATTKKQQAKVTEQLVHRLQVKIEDGRKELTSIDKTGEIPKIPAYRDKIESVERKIAELTALKEKTLIKLNRAEVMEGRVIFLRKEIDEHDATIKSLPSAKDIPDIPEIEQRLATAKKDYEKNKQNKNQYGLYRSATDIKKELDALKAEAEKYSKSLSCLRKDLPGQLIKEANIPIIGFRFEGDKVFLNNTNIDNLSTSEQVSLALSIVRQINKNAPLKMLCLDRVESLDDDTLDAFTKQIQGDEFQYFITIVKHKNMEIPKGAFQIKDGVIS